ncbi:MAG: hypothetical protein HY069_04110 [Chlamydiia bacterium]|nr:hypothetical protein [Chlamydiia bacterium]
MIDAAAYRLSVLLPYAPQERAGKQLGKSLDEYRFILHVARDALGHLVAGRLEQFDALVGENACQIRAIKIASMASRDLSPMQALIEKIDSVLLKIPTLSLSAHKTLTLQQLIEANDLDISCSVDVLFAVASYILYVMTDFVHPEKMQTLTIQSKKSNYKLLDVPAVTVTNTFKDFLAKKTKQFLSAASVQFVHETAAAVGGSQLQEILQSNVRDHNSWKCVPMFRACQALLSFAQKEKIPLVLRVKFIQNEADGYKYVEEDGLYFTSDGTQYVCSDQPPQSAACTIQGIAPIASKGEWRTKMLEHGPVPVVLAGAADHRQYPNPEYGIDRVDPEYEEYQAKAKAWGCALDNPSLFFIQHVYPTTCREIPKT